MCTSEKCSERSFCEDPNVWAPGNVDYSNDLNQVGESNLVAVHTRKISEFAFKEGMVMINSALIPSSAVLFDNGATLNCAKNAAGHCEKIAPNFCPGLSNGSLGLNAKGPLGRPGALRVGTLPG